MANGTISYQELLEHCAQKQSLALKQLYELEAPHFLALGQSLLQRNSDAEELVRETLVLIWRNASAYDPSLGSARAWMYSILRFRAQQKRQKNAALSPLTKAKSQFYIPATASPELLQFQHLGDATKHMIALAYLYGFNYAEIAKECHESIQQTKNSLQEGLLRLTHLFTGWHNHSDQSLILLGEYCLGLLDNAETASPAHQLLQTDSTATQDLLLWEDVFSHLALCLPKLTPPAYVLSRIYQDLHLPLSEALAQGTPKANPAPEPTATVSPTTPSASLLEILHTEKTAPTDHSLPPDPPNYGKQSTPEPVIKPPKKEPIRAVLDSPPASFSAQTQAELIEAAYDTPPKKERKIKLGWWIGGGVLTALCAFAIWAFMPKAPIVQLVQMSPQAGAVLQAPGLSTTPGWILSVDPEGHVLLTPQVRTEIATGQSVQLWTQHPNDTQIRSLGVINPNQPVTLPAELIGPVESGQIFEMTLEASQGASSPTGAILFIGRVVKFGEFAPLLEQSDV